jgi:hypothetical protein
MSLTIKQRDRLAAPTVAIYWLVLLLGLALYTSVRSDEPYVTIPIWIGALGGTVLGQSLALRDYRLWVTAFVVVGVAVNGTALAPVGVDAMHFWLAFVPAALCGAFSLGDRAPLAAFWFPAVIWMLSILDRTDGKAIPGGVSAMLLGVLAILFVAFLYVRETRRVNLWRVVAPVPLAEETAGEVLREAPGTQLSRAVWGVLLAGVTCALTAWVAPQLWQIETFGGPSTTVAVGDPTPGDGPPCCPREDDIDTERARVREYFDLGRGHDHHRRRHMRTHDACVMCTSDGIPLNWDPDGVPYVGVTEGGGGTGGDGGYGGYGRPSMVAPTPTPVPMPDPPVIQESLPEPVPAPPPPAYQPPRPEPPRPKKTPRPAHVDPPPPPPIPAATVTPDPTPEPPPPVVTPPPEPPKPSPRPSPQPRAPQAAQAPAPSDAGGELLKWIVLLVTAGLLSQVARYALRPLRRAVTLRHLRRPLWRETVDQRISNHWQLILVGLRDAGWRTTASEAPREFARRVDLAGVEPAAQILERARHGIGIDAADLAQMGEHADTAYQSARRPLGLFARLFACLRWPLT